jgi:hypothetical protein
MLWHHLLGVVGGTIAIGTDAVKPGRYGPPRPGSSSNATWELFPVSTPEDARGAAELADGIVVASRAVEVAEEAPDTRRIRPLPSTGRRCGRPCLSWSRL